MYAAASCNTESACCCGERGPVFLSKLPPATIVPSTFWRMLRPGASVTRCEHGLLRLRVRQHSRRTRERNVDPRKPGKRFGAEARSQNECISLDLAARGFHRSNAVSDDIEACDFDGTFNGRTEVLGSAQEPAQRMKWVDGRFSLVERSRSDGSRRYLRQKTSQFRFVDLPSGVTPLLIEMQSGEQFLRGFTGFLPFDGAPPLNL